MKLEEALGRFAEKEIAFIIDSSEAFHSLCEILAEKYIVSDNTSYRGSKRDIYAYSKHAVSIRCPTLVRSNQPGYAVTSTSYRRYEWVDASSIEDLGAEDSVVSELNLLLSGAKMGQ